MAWIIRCRMRRSVNKLMSHFKIIAPALGILLATIHTSLATEPYETLTTASPSGAYRVEQRPRWDDAVGIFDASNRLLHNLPVTNVLQFCQWTGKYAEDFEVSTAGIDWHLNSLAFITSDDTTFLMRHRSGNVIAIDLARGQPRPVTPDETTTASNRFREMAIPLLDSADAGDRETGCIHCGQLGATQAVARIQELLDDKAFYTVSGGNYPESTAVLYVRKAAVDALAALGQPAAHVQFEFPERDVVNWDPNISRYVVVLPPEETVDQDSLPPVP